MKSHRTAMTENGGGTVGAGEAAMTLHILEKSQSRLYLLRTDLGRRIEGRTLQLATNTAAVEDCHVFRRTR